MKENMKQAWISSIPVMMGYIVLGTAFGMLLESKGYGILYALLMSVFIYAGSMQFVAINLLVSGANLLSVAIMTLLINARHVVYGLSMIHKFEDLGALKPYMIFSLTDETYSLLVASQTPQGCEEKYYLFFISFFNQCYWVIGSVLGTLLGSLMIINTAGLDFAMTALFVVIVLEQFLTSSRHIYTYIGFGVSLVCLLLFGSESFIIPSMIGMVIGLFMVYNKGGQRDA